jgi:galactokinase/galacturonokinase
MIRGSMQKEYPSFIEQTAKTTAMLRSTWPVDPASIQHVVAPYRVCPLGAHVDHQGGHVLGRTINIGTVLSFAPRAGAHVQLQSTAFDTAANFNIGDAVDMTHWARYAQAAALALQEQYPLSRGMVGVADGALIGAGLSSSASVGLAYLLALATVNDISLPADELVELDRQLENDHLGLQNGILDQSSIVYGCALSLTHIQVRDHQVTAVPDPANMQEACWLVVYSGVPRILTSTDYNQRVEQCRQAAQWLEPDASVLSDVPLDQFQQKQGAMPGFLRRRATHFYGEVERVAQGVKAWEVGDFNQFGALMNESCTSSVEQYECGHEAVINLQQIVSRAPGVYGSRFSGGGYGGCVIALIDPEHLDSVSAAILDEYQEHYPDWAQDAAVYRAHPADGLQEQVANEQN